LVLVGVVALPQLPPGEQQKPTRWFHKKLEATPAHTKLHVER
jgi:hypothetical protein